jgi:hypothetical protein
MAVAAFDFTEDFLLLMASSLGSLPLEFKILGWLDPLARLRCDQEQYLVRSSQDLAFHHQQHQFHLEAKCQEHK